MKRIFFSLLFALSCSAPPPSKERVFPVTVTRPIQKDVPFYLEYPGHIEAYKKVELQAQVSGNLTGMYFEEGSEVKAGQLLFTIDSRPYIASLEKAEATLKGSIASLEIAEDTVKRYSPLVKDQFVSQLNYDQYVASSLENNAAVQANLADIETAKINLSYCTLYAPMDAVAGKKEIDVGNYIKVGEQTPLIILNQINPIYASFYVPDVDLPIIQKYQLEQGPLTTEIYLGGVKADLSEGKLTLIDNEVNQATGAIFMKATLANEKKILWPGEFVDVKIILSTLKDALLLPSQALQFGGKGYFAFVITKENQAELRLVEIGQRHGDLITVLSGIDADDVVVLEGQLNLSSGAQVEIRDKKEQQ